MLFLNSLPFIQLRKIIMNYSHILPIIFAILMGLFFTSGQATETGQPEELGKVRWERDFVKGLAKAKASNKAVFLLFQEVPGCSTCRNYGHNVLSHPLIVEAIETLFVPVAIYNNKGGADAAVLKAYNEPSWNNPVVRIVNEDRKNLIPRVSGNYSQLGVVSAMKKALKTQNKTIPAYLELLEQELMAEKRGTETAVFSMYCFWTGEKVLGALDGVVGTQPGFMNGREVVKVQFDPAVIQFDEMLSHAKNAQCASQVYTQDSQQKLAAIAQLGIPSVAETSKFSIDREPKYYMSKTAYRFIPMTPLQAAKVNSLIGQRKSPDTYLSAYQRELLTEIKSNPKKPWKNMINVDLTKGWEEVQEMR